MMMRCSKVDRTDDGVPESCRKNAGITPRIGSKKQLKARWARKACERLF